MFQQTVRIVEDVAVTLEEKGKIEREETEGTNACLSHY
jgi:hypothetical protein